jgi:murein DD-endopeptidase MepM/ murein hydrolase activator NlpD
MNNNLISILQKHKPTFHPVVKIDAEKSNIINFDFTANNKEITPELIADTTAFSNWVDERLASASATFGIGGYNENRTLYQRSKLFASEQPRSIHLGVDIWGAVGTAVHAPIGGMVHSFAFNNNFGDYGATVILQHNLDTTAFYTLYGHLSLADLELMRKGKFITRGEVIGHFGNAAENGNWPPHLHFQIIEDIGINEGDYPGVCSVNESQKYLSNCPDANLMLNF